VKSPLFYAIVCISGVIAMHPYLAQSQLLPFVLGELTSISYNYMATSSGQAEHRSGRVPH